MKKKEFEGKVALITGASRGIGRAIAIELAKNGASISINFNIDKKAAEKTKKIVDKLGVESRIFKANVSKEKEVKALISSTEKKFGKIDMLVTNAGILKLPKEKLQLDYSMWKKVMTTNLDGTLLTIKETLPGMMKRKYGRIVCISSVAGFGSRPSMIAYATSKAAVIALVRNLSSAIAPFVRINSIAPGLIETDMGKTFNSKVKNSVLASTPLKRLGSPEDIAKTVYYLLSEQSSFSTGQTLIVDGGKLTLT